MTRIVAMLALATLVLASCVTAPSTPGSAAERSPVPADTPLAPSATQNPELKPTPTSAEPTLSFVFPTEDGVWTPPGGSHTMDRPSATGNVRIDGIGEFSFDGAEVQTLRPDVFRPGYFSVFDVLAHLAVQGDIDLKHHFDEDMDTHVIDAINGQRDWWYRAYYSGGWAEDNVMRMDHFPYKDRATIRLLQARPDYLEAIYQTFREEVQRLERNGGKVVIPEVVVRSPRANYSFRDVAVSAHDVRSDALQRGVITALDALISLGEQGWIPALKLTWYEAIGSADPVQHYFAEQIGDSVAYDRCGFVYETGPRSFRGFMGTHIHIPSDMRVTVSPEYALWFWICL
jgi:hypothetical protein